VSNRNDTSFGRDPPIDSLAFFSISKSNGQLTRGNPVSAHGAIPRHFSFNKAGDLLAVATQKSGIVTILRKSDTTHAFDQKAAEIRLPKDASSPICVIWDE
jgi:6-phosphogluconolactonase (cycloisomerase 2 family)